MTCFVVLKCCCFVCADLCIFVLVARKTLGTGNNSVFLGFVFVFTVIVAFGWFPPSYTKDTWFSKCLKCMWDECSHHFLIKTLSTFFYVCV